MPLLLFAQARRAGTGLPCGTDAIGAFGAVLVEPTRGAGSTSRGTLACEDVAVALAFARRYARGSVWEAAAYAVEAEPVPTGARLVAGLTAKRARFAPTAEAGVRARAEGLGSARLAGNDDGAAPVVVASAAERALPRHEAGTTERGRRGALTPTVVAVVLVSDLGTTSPSGGALIRTLGAEVSGGVPSAHPIEGCGAVGAYARQAVGAVDEQIAGLALRGGRAAAPVHAFEPVCAVAALALLTGQAGYAAARSTVHGVAAKRSPAGPVDARIADPHGRQLAPAAPFEAAVEDAVDTDATIRARRTFAEGRADGRLRVAPC